MTLFHHYQNEYLSFLDVLAMKKSEHVEFESNSSIDEYKRKDKPRKWQVTELTRHLSYETINAAMQFIPNIKKIQDAKQTINIPTKTLQNGLYETTSEITGTAIPAYFCYKTKGSLPFDVEKCYNELTTSKLLELSNFHCSEKSKYIYKTLQITNYNWVNDEQLDACMKRMSGYIHDPTKAAFEVMVVAKKSVIFNTIMTGFVDCIEQNKDKPDYKTIWEFKCVSKLESEHFIQLAVYAFLMLATNTKWDASKLTCKLANILTDEIWEMTVTFDQVQNLVEFLVGTKLNTQHDLTDEQFINTMNNRKTNVKQKVFVDDIAGVQDSS